MKRKLVQHPKGWPWSSWSHYAKSEEGLIRIDTVVEGQHRDRIGQYEEEESQNTHP